MFYRTVLDSGVEITLWDGVSGLEYAGNIALFSHDAQTIQRALDHLVIEVSRLGMCKVRVQDGQQPLPAPNVCTNWLEIVNSINLLGSLIIPEGWCGEDLHCYL